MHGKAYDPKTWATVIAALIVLVLADGQSFDRQASIPFRDTEYARWPEDKEVMLEPGRTVSFSVTHCCDSIVIDVRALFRHRSVETRVRSAVGKGLDGPAESSECLMDGYSVKRRLMMMNLL